MGQVSRSHAVLTPVHLDEQLTQRVRPGTPETDGFSEHYK